MELRKACWYLSRYGKQPYSLNEKMTVREISLGVNAISDFLDAEAKAVSKK